MKALAVTLFLGGYCTVSLAGDISATFDDAKEPVELVTKSDGTLECWSTKRAIYEKPTGSSELFKACVKAFAQQLKCDIDTALGRLQRAEVLQDEKTSGYFIKMVERTDL